MRRLSLRYSVYHLLWRGVDLLLPPVCAGCGRPGDRWCANCVRDTIHFSAPLCESCGTETRAGARLCADCARHRPRYRSLRSWAAFAGPIRRALHGLKYRRDIGFGEALTPELRDFVVRLNQPVDLLVPVPLAKNRLRERGYNQVSVLARPLSMALGIRFEAGALRRSRETRSQVGLTRAERHDNVHGAFNAEPRRVNGRKILLMDDVATTGSTLSSCAEALYSAGAQDVFAVTVARAVFPRDGVRP